MIRPYTVVGLIPTVRGIRKRDDIAVNLEHIAHMVKAAAWLSSLELPVRLIALPEGALQVLTTRRSTWTTFSTRANARSISPAGKPMRSALSRVNTTPS